MVNSTTGRLGWADWDEVAESALEVGLHGETERKPWDHRENGGFSRKKCGSTCFTRTKWWFYHEKWWFEGFPSERGDVNRRRCEHKTNPNALSWKECFLWETPLRAFKDTVVADSLSFSRITIFSTPKDHYLSFAPRRKNGLWFHMVSFWLGLYHTKRKKTYNVHLRTVGCGNPATNLRWFHAETMGFTKLTYSNYFTLPWGNSWFLSYDNLWGWQLTVTTIKPPTCQNISGDHQSPRIRNRMKWT